MKASNPGRLVNSCRRLLILYLCLYDFYRTVSSCQVTRYTEISTRGAEILPRPVFCLGADKKKCKHGKLAIQTSLLN